MTTSKRKNGISIYLFGTPSIQVDGQMFLLKRKRIRALIYYLAASPVPVCREELISIFLPQLDRITALKNLSTYIYNIRTVLPNILSVNKDFLYIPSDVYVDVREFESCTGDEVLSFEKARKAEQLYRDSFLNHFDLENSAEYEQWKEARSEYYANSIIKAKRFIADTYIKSGAYKRANDMLEQIIALNPYGEDTYRTAMKVNYRMGNRPGVVRLFDRLTHILGEELGITPMAETIKLYTDIITKDNDTYDASGDRRETDSPVTLPDISENLEHLSGNAKNLLNVLVVFHEDFDLKVVSQIVGFPEPEIMDLLEELENERIVRITSDNKIFFFSPQGKDFLYNSISSLKRKYLHFRIAQSLEQSADLSSYHYANILLYHYQNSGDSDQTLKYALLVGEIANDRGDFQKAIDCYKQASFFLRGKYRQALELSLSQSLLLMGKYAESRKLLLSNAEICKSNYEFGLENYFYLEAALTKIPGFNEIMWGIRPQFPIAIDEKVISNIWIAEKHLPFEEENREYYVRFLQSTALYYEAAMQPEQFLICYEKSIDIVKDLSNPRLKNYTDFACLKLGLYYEDQNKAEQFLRIGIANASEKGNLRILPFLLAASCELDISMGRKTVARHNLDWAQSIADLYNNIYAQMAIKTARAHLYLYLGQEETAVSVLKEVYDLGCEINSTHALMKACKEILTLEAGRPYWEDCRRILNERKQNTEIIYI
ncbi:MAG: BTAD domain-containing putative transcriptional regulator [Eubacteriales bacterium]|nr:BTAD domain-containing putative transcriptional regulator [Eubacteriales bacterium]